MKYLYRIFKLYIVFLSLLIFCFPSSNCTGKKNEKQIKMLLPQFVEALFQDDFDRGGKLLQNITEHLSYSTPEKLTLDNHNTIILHSIARKLSKPFKSSTSDNLNTFIPLSTKTDLFFDYYDLKYLRNILILKKLSDSICSGAENDLDKVILLMNWIFYHVYPHNPIPDTEPIGALPYDILERGFGLCDRMSWLFCALAQQQDIKASVVYLYPPEGGSNHTIVQVFLDKPFLIDPQNAIIFKNQNGLIGLQQINSDPSILLDLHPVYNDLKKFDFKRSIIFMTAHPYSFIPKMKAVQYLFGSFHKNPPVIYTNIKEEFLSFDQLYGTADHIVKIADTRSTTPILVQLPSLQGFFALWDYPLRFPWRSYDELVTKGILLPGLNKYREARKFHILGRYDESLELYKEVIKNSNNPNAVEDCTYFQGILYFDMGDYDKSSEVFEQYLKSGYNKWENHAFFLLCRAYKKIGEGNKASEVFNNIEDISIYLSWKY